MTPQKVFMRLAWALLGAYFTCWVLGYLAWWMVLGYGMVVTVAWAETGDREQHG